LTPDLTRYSRRYLIVRSGLKFGQAYPKGNSLFGYRYLAYILDPRSCGNSS